VFVQFVSKDEFDAELEVLEPGGPPFSETERRDSLDKSMSPSSADQSGHQLLSKIHLHILLPQSVSAECAAWCSSKGRR